MAANGGPAWRAWVVAGVVAVGCVFFLPAASAAFAVQAACGPLRSSTLVIECSLGDRPVDCTSQNSPEGTVAVFRCKPLHQFLFDYLPASGYESRCGKHGEWSVRPFRCVPVCGRPTGKPTALIRGGEKVTSAADFPWHVAIYDVTINMEQVCGGSLISTKFFISAAHCFHDQEKPLPPTRYIAAFARTKRRAEVNEPNSQYREIKMIHFQRYEGKKLNYANDIALVELSAAVDVTAWTLPVCVDWAGDQPQLDSGKLGMVVGYGSQPERPSDDLRFAMLPYVDKEICRKAVPDALAIFNDQPDKFCVGAVDGKTVSKGDSGGGMAFASDRQWFLRGVLSVGSLRDTTYSFFTNVTTFIPWIAGIIRQGETSGRRCGVDVDEMHVVDGKLAENNGFPWEVDIYAKRATRGIFKRMWTGVLINPNLIITSAVESFPGDFNTNPYDVDLSEYPSAWLRVGLNYTVVRTFYPNDVFLQTGIRYNLLLLETEQPLRQMPVCYDWSGNALLGKQKQGTMVYQRPADQIRMWKRFEILDSATCRRRIPLVNLGEQHICSYHAGFIMESSMRSMQVNVENTWFLRGIWSHKFRSEPDLRDSLAIYTDMSNPGVRSWMARTRDIVGKPVCGNMALCQPLAAGLVVPARTPWGVDVVVRNTTRRSGLLVNSGAVITDGSLVVNTTGYNGAGIVPTIEAENIIVEWTDADGRLRTSKVLRVFPYESKAQGTDAKPRYTIALLELDPRTTIPNMPVCLDLSGNVLQPLGTGQLGLVETGDARSNHTLLSSSVMLRTECVNILTRLSHPSAGPYTFCATSEKNATGTKSDRNVRGGGFLIQSGSKWFVQGLLSNLVRLRRSDMMVVSDFNDYSLRVWLKRKLDAVLTVHSEQLADKTLTTCAGKRPTLAECGVINESDDFEVVDEDSDLERPKLVHMQWNVQVVIRNDNVRSGTLVKPNMVLTSSADIIATGGVVLVATAEVIVKYLNSISSGWRIAEVERIYWKEEAAPAQHSALFTLALLKLKTPLPLMPICVPGPHLPELAQGSKGTMEVWLDGRELQVPTHYRRRDECVALVGNNSGFHLPENELCVEADTWGVLYGVAFAVQTENAWFLRGLVHLPKYGGKKNLHVLFSLEDRTFLSWLHDKMRIANETEAPLENQPLHGIPTGNLHITLTEIKSAKITSAPAAISTHVECGITTFPLKSVTNEAAVSGSLPWSVFVVMEKLTLEAAGVLVRRDVVLTDGITLTDSSRITWLEFGAVEVLNTSMVRVAWISPSGTWFWSKAKAIHVHEVARDWQNIFAMDVALIELETPFEESTPVCIDLVTPSALKPLQSVYLGVIPTWQGDYKENRSALTAKPYLPRMKCSAMLKEMQITVAERIMSTQFCTNLTRVEIYGGAPFLVESTGKWYVRGLASYSFGTGYGPYAWTDLGHPSLKAWLKEKLEGVVDEAPGNPNEPQSVSCGQTALPLETLTAGTTLPGSLPWSVHVTVQEPDKINHFVGALIRHDLVLTVGTYLVSPFDHSNDTGDVFAYAPDRIRVLWVSPSWREEMSKVRAVHVHELQRRVRDAHAYDVALLELKTPFAKSMLACIDLSNTLPRIQHGQIGVIPSHGGSHERSEVNGVTMRLKIEECSNSQRLQPDMGPAGICLSTKPDENTLILRGAAAHVRSGDRWYIRGVVVITYGTHGPHILANLDEPHLKNWLHQFFPQRRDDDAPALLSAPDPESVKIWFPTD